MIDSHIDAQVELIDQEVPHVVVTIVERRGSVPQEIGAKAVVTKDGLFWGTVGGGKVEAEAIQCASDMLASGDSNPVIKEIHLSRDLGMTCGGRVRLLFEVFAACSAWRIVIFGAGHVAQALVRVLAPMNCTIDCCDPRSEWIEKLPVGENIRTTVTADLAAEIDRLPNSCQIVIMTQGHKHDLPILERAIRQQRFTYIGVIGSRSKSSRLRRALLERGLDEKLSSEFLCPIGFPIGRSSPEEISLSIASQLLWHRDVKQSRTADKWRTKLPQELPWLS